MKIKAAVAFEAAKPLVIEELDSAGRSPAKCSCGSRPPVSVTPTRTRSRAAIPRACSRQCSGTRARASSRRWARASRRWRRATTSCRSTCRSVGSASSASRARPLCITLRDKQGKGLMPDGTSRLSYKGRMIHHYMGTSTFAERTVLPEIAIAEIRPDAPLDKVCLFGCAVSTGIGPCSHREGGAGCERRGVRARRRRPLGDPGRGARGRGTDHRDRHQPREVRDGQQFGATHTLTRRDGQPRRGGARGLGRRRRLSSSASATSR